MFGAKLANMRLVVWVLELKVPKFKVKKTIFLYETSMGLFIENMLYTKP